MTREQVIQNVETERKYLEDQLVNMVNNIGPIPIANKDIMPYGWRKSAKGRTVWRILEEVISQNLEKHAKSLGFDSVIPAESEVSVYDFKFVYQGGKTSYVNIKSAVESGKKNQKDDISKAVGLHSFYEENPDANLYIASFVLRFNDDMTVAIVECTVFPIAWIPDVYVNPSNNGNLQSAHYKDISEAVKRTNEEFRDEFEKAHNVALDKKEENRKKKEIMFY